jgi:GntR family transcriptional regulator/MocR family aminotransferase
MVSVDPSGTGTVPMRAKRPVPTSASYSITVRLQADPEPAVVGRIATAVGAAGGIVTAVDVAESRHDRITAVLGADFGRWLRVVPSAAGLHLAARAVDGVPVEDVRRRAAAAGVAVESLADYCGGPPQPGLVRGYGLVRTDRIDAGLARLADAFRTAEAGA